MKKGKQSQGKQNPVKKELKVDFDFLDNHAILVKSMRFSFDPEPVLQCAAFSHGHRRRRAVSFRLCLTQEEEEEE